MMYLDHCRSITELLGWVEENGSCISFWLSRGTTSCLRPYSEYRLTPLHLILLPSKLMGDYLSRKADGRTASLREYIQLKRMQYRVFPVQVSGIVKGIFLIAQQQIQGRLSHVTVVFPKSAETADFAFWADGQWACSASL